MPSPVPTPVPPRTLETDLCPPVPDMDDIKDLSMPPQNLTMLIALRPSVTVVTPIIMMSVGICCNIVAAGVFHCSRSAHRDHAFYGILRGIIYTNIVGYLQIYPIVILGHMNGLHWIGSSRLCKFHGIAILNYGLCQAYLTGALAWERFLATCRPGTYDKKIEKRKIPYIIALMWIVALFTALLPLAGFGQFAEMYPNTWCFLDWRYEETVGRLFCSILATAVSAICLFLLSSMVVSAGVCAYRTYTERRSKFPAVVRYRVEVDGHVGNSVPHSSRSNGQIPQGSRHRHMNASDDDIPYGRFRSHLCWATFQYSLIASSFFLCYIPMVIRIITNVSGKPENLWEDMAAVHRIEYYPISLPVIYILFHKQLLFRFARYKSHHRGQHPPPYRQRPLAEGRSIYEVQRYKRYNDANHLRGGALGHSRENLGNGHENHVNRKGLESRTFPTAKRKVTYPGRVMLDDTMHQGDDSEGTESHETGNCQTDASLESLLAAVGPVQHSSRSPRFSRANRNGQSRDAVDITVLERLMDSTEKNHHKNSASTKIPKRLESVI